MTASTPEDRRFPALNAVRAVAALGVVATHTAFDTGEVNRGALGAVLSRLDFGVTLFFVLSGFLLSRPFFRAAQRGRPRPSYSHFLWKRGLRILPLYWITVVAALLLIPENAGAGARVWLTNLTLTQIYVEGLLPTGLTQMWSLCTEVAFYLLLPALVALLLGRSGESGWAPGRVMVGLLLLTTVGFAWQTVAASTSDVVGQHYHQWLPGFMPWFSVGIMFAVASVHSPTRPGTSPWRWFERAGDDLAGCWLVAAAVFTVACTPVAGPRLLITPSPDEALVKSVLYTVSAAFFVLPLVFGPEYEGLVRRAASSRFAVWMGDISYGIFCLHLLALEAAMSVLDVEEFTGRFWAVFALTVTLTVLLAAPSYHLLERPILSLKNSGPFAPRAAAERTSPSKARD
jgi:peptidoglycan/LPS O-acetylase OafA/YrhL